MVGVNGATKLKRKREDVEAQRKKAKTQKKSNTAEAQVENGTPRKASTVTPHVSSKTKPISTPKEEEDVTPTPQVSHTNGALARPAIDTPSSSRKDKRKQTPKKTRGDEVPSDPSGNTERTEFVEARNTNAGQAQATLVPFDQEKHGKSKKKGKSKKSWTVSDPQGGWFLPQDPIFSPDEKHLLVAKLNSFEVYATDTSLLAREFLTPSKSVILAYAISSAQPDHVYIAESTGKITLWNWASGSKVGRWDIGAKVGHLAAVKQPDSIQDLLYCHEVSHRHIVNVHALRTGDEASETGLKQILSLSKSITGIQVLLQGKIVVVSTAKSILIGKRRKLHKTTLQDFEYTWREFETSKPITTFSAYVRIPDIDQSKKSQQDPRDHLDLAIGDDEGVIHLFEDVISTFAAIERSQKANPGKSIGPESLRPRRLHWHRDAVASLKWSLDGNYLISGGSETVLAIWQLSTGKKQHLPHLTAAIESIVVSPTGASYAIALANNSVIVLSTSELKAKTNITGIQSRRIDYEQLPRESDIGFSFDLFNPVPMTVDSKNTNHIIVATPSSQPVHVHARLPSEPYAQTFDIATHRSVRRQALTRNNATEVNVGPEGKNIEEPSVKHLQISNDGTWLATVDEWTPSCSSLHHVEEGVLASKEEEQAFRREVYLKAWRWDEKGTQWVLDARIDAPHFFEDVSAPARVFDLVADPYSTGFATVGEDRVVRIWRPKTRTRNGVVVRGGDRAQGLVTWSLDRSVKIASTLDIAESNQGKHETSAVRSCRLAFSADGSVLAVGVSWTSEADPGVIHIIDTEDGVIRRSITEIDMAALSGLVIVGRYLIAVGTSIAIWDMVMDQLVDCIPIKTAGVDAARRVQLVRLAVNNEDGTFAVATPHFEKKKSKSKSKNHRRILSASTKVSIFDPSQPKACWTQNIPEVVLALASAKGGRGYISLAASSSIRIISPRSASLQLPPPLEPAACLLPGGMEVEEEHDEDVDESELKKQELDLQLEVGQELLSSSENDKPVVRPEQLQEIFESGPSHALPPAKNVFDAVVGLYARKPRTMGVRAA